MVIAVDFDEVLFLTVLEMIDWYEKEFGFRPDYEDFKNYRFHEAFKTDQDTATVRYIDFANSDHSQNISPLSAAVDVLKRRIGFGDKPFIASSSQVEVVESKQKRIEKFYKGIFHDFHAANHYSLTDGPVCSKADICRQIEAGVMIDDNPKHLLECVPFVKIPILFGHYPWNRGKFPGIYRAADWQEVEIILDARI